MTQRQLIIEYLFKAPYIIPAKMTGAVFMGVMFGSEISRVCRKLRAEGILESERVGKFEKYKLK